MALEEKYLKSIQTDELYNSDCLPQYITPVISSPQTRYGNNRWETFSPKIGRNVVLYSDLEYDSWVLIECNPKIQSFCEQPLKIQIKTPKGIVTTIFDLWVLWVSGNVEFREVKYQSDLKNSVRAARQIEAQSLWCKQRNIVYSVCTEREIRANSVYLNNCKQIIRYVGTLKKELFESHILHIQELLVAHSQISIEEVLRSFPSKDAHEIITAIAKLIYKGSILSDIYYAPLSKKTRLEMHCGNNEKSTKKK